MKLNEVEIEDTYSEGFGTYFTRILVTAVDKKRLDKAAQVATGFATSVIHCPCEASIDCYVSSEETPDKRPGVMLMFFVNKKEDMDKVLLDRVGQCVLTAATTSVFDGFTKSLNPEKEFSIKTGNKLRFFGDGFEEKVDDYSFPVWKIPCFDGDFYIQEAFKGGKGAGGNFILFAESQEAALKAADRAGEAILEVKNIIAPFPGGFVRSGSKVGSKYSFLSASTNEVFCPSLKDEIENSQLKPNEKAGYEIVLDGATEESVKKAMKKGINAAVGIPGVTRITAGNYGGKLGKFQYHLHDVLGGE
ncbi:MAG: Formylmethanofuran--tetrahydromethanopterin formyltransferase [Promethearchaeota archaeon]|nr:MAG: Formylmethanofuran--tetrahydromethanopterin formyltransferase [Candidatus Lokiarchaeota archaeon]